MNKDFRCNVSVAAPYPPVQPQNRNREYALEMLSNVGGSNSEMSAVSLYFYNSVILDPNYPAFAKCFQEINIVEMHHLDMFAELAYKLGEDPRLWSNPDDRKTYWTPAYNNYPREIHNVIINSIEAEEAAIQKYSNQLENIPDPNIKNILNRIILDEKRHLEIFRNMLNYIA